MSAICPGNAGSVTYETGDVPGFVIAIFVTLLILFNSFAVNMWLQYRRIGRWRDPLFAEKAYLVGFADYKANARTKNGAWPGF
jgi:hypothetical protein